MHVHNERNFSQAKLEHGDLYFLSHYNCVHITSLIKTKSKNSLDAYRKKIISESVQKTVRWNANYDSENNDYMNVLIKSMCF